MGCAGERLSREEARFFADADPLGFVLFRRNCRTRDQLRELVHELRSCVGRADAPVLIDQEVRRIIETAYNAAMQLLRDNMDKLHLLANTLLEREVLDGDEMDRVLHGEKLEPLRPATEPEPAETAAAAQEPLKGAAGQKLEPFSPPSPRPAGA